MMYSKYKQLYDLMRQKLSCTAHGVDHIKRVLNMALYLAQYEQDVNLEVLIPAALLHDIARAQEDNDPTNTIDHAQLGAVLSAEILDTYGYSQEAIEAICHCIATHRLRSHNKPQSIEAKILYDADKLDVLGAVGIGRIFMFAGQVAEPMHLDMPLETYRRQNIDANGRILNLSHHAPNMEYDLKIKNIATKLFTSRAKEIARERLNLMETFFSSLHREFTQLEHLDTFLGKDHG